MPNPAPPTRRQDGKRPPLTTRQRAMLAAQYARTGHHHTKGIYPQVAPFAAVGALTLASAALNAAKDATEADAQILGGTAATCFVVAVVAAVQFRQRLNDRKSLLRAYGFITVCAGWLTSTTAFGLSLNAVGVLGAMGAALSFHWWREKRIPNTRPAPTPPPVDGTAAEAARYMNRWAEHLGAPGGPLAGSTLEAPKKIDSGWQFVLRLVPGKQHIAALMSIMMLVRGGLGLTIDQDVMAERHPVLAEPNVRLTVVTKSPIKDDVVWPGPETFVDGRVRLGPYSDGIGHAHWTVYKGGRMKGGFLQGGSGSGKTRMVESIALSVAASETHPTVVWYGDGQGNSSSPMLMKHCDWGAQNFEQIGVMFAAAHLVMELRQDENGLNEAIDFTPTDDRPGLLIILSECHKPLSKMENPVGWAALQKIIESIAREGQKVGVAEILETQESTLGAFGGAGVNNSPEMIRSNLLMGNGVMLRSLDSNAKQVFKVPDDPSQFPELPGYALMVAGDAGGRTATFRGYYVTDKLRDEWAPRIRWRSLDTGSGNAAGKVYLQRRELAEQARETIRLRVQARRNGTYVSDNLDLMAGLVTPPPAGGDGSTIGDFPPITPFPVWDLRAATGKRPASEMHQGHKAVLAQLGSGVASPKGIAEATGYSERQVHNLLDELMDKFQVVQRAGHGRYVATDVESPC